MRRPRLIAGLAVAVAAWATWSALTAHHASDRGTWAVLLPLSGLTYVGTGLYARHRRPAERLGPLMIGLGFAFMAQGLLFADSPLPFSIGLLLSPLWGALFVHLVLSAPDGRLRDTASRVVVAATYLTFVPLQAAAVVVSDPADVGGCSARCVDNTLRVTHVQIVSDALILTWNVMAIGIALASIVVLVARWRRATAAERRALAPTLIGGTALAVLFVVAQVTGSHLAGFAAQIVLAVIPFAFLAGLARAHVSRAAGVRALVERLGGRPGPEALRAALAEALGDPGLTLAFWLPDQHRYADASGAPVDLPAGDGPRAATEIEYQGRRVAAIIHDRGLCDDRDAVLAAGAAAALTLENQRLDAELRARLDELRASRGRLVRAGDDERRRLERDLHDGAQARFVAVALQLRLAAMRLPPDSEAAQLLDAAVAELRVGLEELRELARGIHPTVLTNLGLVPALRTLADRATVPVEVRADLDGRMPPAVETAAYFVAAEALANVAKYAQARGASIHVARDNGTLIVEVADDGRGGADPGRGSGLRGLADRVGAIDGRLTVESPAGKGTRVRAEIPCE